MTAQSALRWQVVGRSVCGSTHRRNGQPNQDAILWCNPGGPELAMVLAVADGHGSARSFRSKTGARLAVETSVGLLLDFSERTRLCLSPIDARAERWLSRELVRRWRKAVRAHLAEHPFEEPAASPVPALLPYGSTILAALVTDNILLFIQLGDGDILLVSEDGEVTRPWHEELRYLGVETASLCMPQAWKQVRVVARSAACDPPRLVLLSTDGYSNSFREERGFLNVGRDLLETIRGDGLEQVEDQLESWLAEASQLGSGDDITVGLLYRTEQQA